ncbi:MAG: hypothetical protein JXB19_06100 [Bacteroidales bacterium]|nr:hypothetical protein [Bacteroidales bacterium]
MKKFIKIFFISVASLLAVLIIGICIALWLVFTPERITPIVRNQADKYIACRSEIGAVELTFFSTFPRFGLKVNRFTLINPVADAPSDTLVHADKLVGVLDAAAWWKNKELIITEFVLTNGTIHAFKDGLGHTNFNILIPDTVAKSKTGSEAMFSIIDFRNVELNNINLVYIDILSDLKADIRNLSAKITGTINHDIISGNVKLSRSDISLERKGENYFQHVSVRCAIPAEIIQFGQKIKLHEASVSIDDLEILLDGDIETDSLGKNIIANISYKLRSWPVKNILALVPAGFNSFLTGIDMDGLLTSEGKISGILNDSLMPLMNIHFLLENAMVKYNGFPLPIHDINCDVSFCSDMKTDSLSFVRINYLNAKTPQSNVATKGLVYHLFSDVTCKLTSNAGLTLDEFNTLLPGTMKLNLAGHLSGRILSDFSINQIRNMQLEKMKLSGSVILSDFCAVYDSISIHTDRSILEFKLPNPDASSKNTGYAFAVIASDNMDAGKIESYHASLQNSVIAWETSDVRDTTGTPAIICSFQMDSLTAVMDTIRFAVTKPNGKISVSTDDDQSGQSKISLTYNSGILETDIGQNSAKIEKINIRSDVLHDSTVEDFFLQGMAKGFVEMERGSINLSALSYPIEIPAIIMNFESETLNIKESRVNIDKSDFQLIGNLINVLSYFRGDSILRGNFSFVSATTDILQLMSLTSGIGNADTTVMENPEGADKDSSYTGPYIVPKGIDITLSTNIKQATFGIDTATNIVGSMQVHDGILLLDEITFATSAAKMQLSAMYRTPRKNHLFLGLDYHMLDVEIGELLTMIPDIDTLMPMLRSFGGKGEFHIAVETYLDSLYNIKKSTLRGASSIKGNDLVLMDGETFSEIAKTLRFNKQTENRVDSLSAEFTIFREEIDIYPFLIVMDKYKAVVAGRHNFDLSFDYHISVVDSPLPVKLGVDIKGTMDELDYALVKCRYAEFYRPASRQVVENRQLELRKMIRDALTQKVLD